MSPRNRNAPRSLRAAPRRRSSWPSVADIFHNRSMEQRDVLRHHRNRRAKALLGDPGDVLAIDGDVALIHVVKSLQQYEQGGFPAAGLSYQPNPLACIEAEAELVQYLQAPGITERHLVEDDRRPRLYQRFGFRMVAQFMWKQAAWQWLRSAERHAVSHRPVPLRDRAWHSKWKVLAYRPARRRQWWPATLP